jgi:hypothetical protein
MLGNLYLAGGSAMTEEEFLSAVSNALDVILLQFDGTADTFGIPTEPLREVSTNVLDIFFRTTVDDSSPDQMIALVMKMFIAGAVFARIEMATDRQEA